MVPSKPFPKGNVIGLATRFQLGNKLGAGYGRPRTSLLSRKLRKQLYYGHVVKAELIYK